MELHSHRKDYLVNDDLFTELISSLQEDLDKYKSRKDHIPKIVSEKENTIRMMQGFQNSVHRLFFVYESTISDMINSDFKKVVNEAAELFKQKIKVSVPTDFGKL